MSSNNANEMVKAIRDAQKQIERDSESTAVQNDIIGANLIRLYQDKCYKEMPDVLVFQAMKELPDWMMEVSERFDEAVNAK